MRGKRLVAGGQSTTAGDRILLEGILELRQNLRGSGPLRLFRVGYAEIGPACVKATLRVRFRGLLVFTAEADLSQGRAQRT